MTFHGKNQIGLEQSARGGERFRVTAPATGELLPGEFTVASEEELQAAAERADEAFRRWPRDSRRTADLLERIAANIDDLGDTLVERCSAETALPSGRIKLERGRTTGQLRMFASLVREGSWVDARIDRADPRRRPVPKPDLRRMLVPLGPVAVFPASNFPLAFSTAGGDTASALAAGCPVIVKARPSHAGTSELVGDAIVAALAELGFPDGWFSQLHGPGRSLGLRLVEHPAVKAVGFTGSLSGGRALMAAAAARPEPIPVYAEMGSVNPVFLLPQVLQQAAESIAEGYHQSLTLGVGQFCTNPGLVFGLRGSAWERFTAKLAELVRNTPPGSMLLPAIYRDYQEGVARWRSDHRLACLAEATTPADPSRLQAQAAVFTVPVEAFLADTGLQTEIFGQAALLIECDRIEQMLAAAECLHGQLTATIHAAPDELEKAAPLWSILQCKAGRVLVGGFPTGVEVCAAMHHGGPFPASSAPHFTSVGTAAILRFARPVCYQNVPQALLPPELHDGNPLGIWRLVDNQWTRDAIAPT